MLIICKGSQYGYPTFVQSLVISTSAFKFLNSIRNSSISLLFWKHFSSLTRASLGHSTFLKCNSTCVYSPAFISSPTLQSSHSGQPSLLRCPYISFMKGIVFSFIFMSTALAIFTMGCPFSTSSSAHDLVYSHQIRNSSGSLNYRPRSINKGEDELIICVLTAS